MPTPDSQTFLRELDMNGAERHRRPSNVARRVRAGARIKLWTAAAKLPAGTEILVKGAQVSCLSLPNEKVTEKMKDTGKMPVLRYKITSTGKLIDDALEAGNWKPLYATI